MSIIDCEEVQIVSSTSRQELLAQNLYRAEGKAGPGNKTKEGESSAGLQTGTECDHFLWNWQGPQYKVRDE